MSDATKSSIPRRILDVVGHYHTHAAYTKINPDNPKGPRIPATAKEDAASDHFSARENQYHEGGDQGAFSGISTYHSDKNYNWGFKFYLGTPSGKYRKHTYGINSDTATATKFRSSEEKLN